MNVTRIAGALLTCALLTAPAAARAQTRSSATFAVEALNDYRIVPNVTYHVADGQELKLDVYARRDVTTPQPTVIFIHGGFWAAGSKEASALSLLPWMEMGWNVVNVEYRLARVAQAPAAVEDCLCALRFITQPAQVQAYNIDVTRIVVTGESAGGHLALTTAMIPEEARLDRQCTGSPLPKVAAVVNWYGVTDVADVVDGPHRANAAAQWMGSRTDWKEVSTRLSPLTYVRTGLPPVLTIHGDQDVTVPYEHGVRLRDALTKVNVPNQLLTIPGGRHGGFTREQRALIYTTLREFLKKNGVMR
jgi:acetyl esterase/lipase